MLRCILTYPSRHQRRLADHPSHRDNQRTQTDRTEIRPRRTVYSRHGHLDQLLVLQLGPDGTWSVRPMEQKA
jgi:hypothetical protein